MAAPAAGSRLTPVGIKLDDGFSTKIAFAADSDISFWEKTVQPPGMDGGAAVETTTMFNAVWRTMHPRSLRTMTESSLKAAYDPDLYNQIVSIINKKTTVTVHFPDGSTLAFYGYLAKFAPDALEEGKQAEATITIQPTNQDPTTGAEEAPVLVSVAGT